MIYHYEGELANIANETWGIFLALFALFLLGLQRKRAGEIKILFRNLRDMFWVNIGALVCDILGRVLDGTQDPFLSRILHYADYMVFILNPLLLLLMSVYIAHNIRTEYNKKGWITSFIAVFVLNVIIATSHVWGDWIYYFDATNHYHRGSFFWMNHATGVLAEILAFAVAWKHRQHVRKGLWNRVGLILGLPFVALGLQLLIDGIGFLYISETLILLVIMTSLYKINIESISRQQEELAESYLNSMISQIQPHFLYNVLMAIMGIEKNPPETKHALADFGKYLRGNMDVLNSKEPISFVREMQHVEAYVGLEKLRFQEKLTVEYDLQVKDFEIAALSVQMMVENAIKHGIRYKKGPGTVRIEALEMQEYFLVRVIDDGVGFDSQEEFEPGRSHIGIDSTRERLRLMVDGELEIHSIPDKGTVATIRIPKMEDIFE
ncbi:MAG: histidine kinase [Dorea sp.]|nr:histidine kinase [Dorea sp.]